ncbi:MAG: CpsD/CapB family tyrosine-protein kinase [Dehalococcoidia bacterium]
MLNIRPWAVAREGYEWGVNWSPAVGAVEEAAMTAPIFGVVEERFKQIAARCLDAARAGASQSVAVSSAAAGEGKSSVAIGIAAAAARNLGSDVLILETDMLRPRLVEDFRLESRGGLSDYLSSDIEIETCIQPTRIPNVWLLPAGRPTANPGPLIRSQRFQELMATLHAGYQTIIIDAPPLLTSPHAAVIVNQAESLVLVARAGQTHIQDAANALKAAGEVPVRGIVLNGTRVWLPGWVGRLLGVSRFAIE